MVRHAAGRDQSLKAMLLKKFCPTSYVRAQRILDLPQQQMSDRAPSQIWRKIFTLLQLPDIYENLIGCYTVYIHAWLYEINISSLSTRILLFIFSNKLNSYVLGNIIRTERHSDYLELPFRTHCNILHGTQFLLMYCLNKNVLN